MRDTKRPLLAILLAALPSAALAADKVVIPDPNYASGRATAFVVKGIIEEALGLEVEMATTTAVPVIWEAMARGAGEIDIWTETWLPNQQGLKDKYADEEKTVTLSGKHFDAVQGLCILRAAADEYNIHSVFDLANPETAALFDTNGDGKGELWIGPQGWPSTNIEQVRARDYGYGEFFELQSTDEAVATAGLDAAVKAGKPWVGYCYGPHQNFILYDLVLLQEPPYDPASYVVVQPNEDPDWFVKSYVASAAPPSNVYISWSSSLSERNPELVKLLGNIEYTPEDVNAWALGIINGEDPSVVVKPWIDGHAAEIARWAVE